MGLSKNFFISRRSENVGNDIASYITFEQCLDILYSYINQKTLEQESAVEKMNFEQHRKFTANCITDYVTNKHPLVQGYVDSTGKAEYGRLTKALIDEVLDWSVLTDAMQDPNVSEIQGNDYKSIYVERNGETALLRSDITDKVIGFESAEDMLKIANKLLRFSEVSLSRNGALQGGMTQDGFRVAVVDPSVAAPDKGEHQLKDKSPMFVIRKYGATPPSMEKLINWHSVTLQQAEFMRLLAKTGLPIVICGATGSGKTVLLQSILNNRPPTRRLAVVEDQSELNARMRDANGIDQSNTIQFEARPTPPSGEAPLTYPTFNNVTMQLLRMTPRLIVLGEMRTDEIVSQAITAAYTGHGLYSTIHADSVEDCITRMTKCVQATSNGTPWDVNMQTVCAAIPFVISQQRLDDGSRKMLEFSEIEGTTMKDGKLAPKINTLFKFIVDGQGIHPEDGKLHGEFYHMNKISHKMAEKLKLKALTKAELDVLLSGPEKPGTAITCTFTPDESQRIVEVKADG